MEKNNLVVKKRNSKNKENVKKALPQDVARELSIMGAKVRATGLQVLRLNLECDKLREENEELSKALKGREGPKRANGLLMHLRSVIDNY